MNKVNIQMSEQSYKQYLRLQQDYQELQDVIDMHESKADRRCKEALREFRRQEKLKRDMQEEIENLKRKETVYVYYINYLHKPLTRWQHFLYSVFGREYMKGRVEQCIKNIEEKHHERKTAY